MFKSAPPPFLKPNGLRLKTCEQGGSYLIKFIGMGFISGMHLGLMEVYGEPQGNLPTSHEKAQFSFCSFATGGSIQPLPGFQPPIGLILILGTFATFSLISKALTNYSVSQLALDFRTPY